MPTQRQIRARDAHRRELQEFGALRSAAYKAVEACTDLETMLEAARPYWLARADEEEAGNRLSPWVRIFRVRANSEDYLRIWCIARMADQLRKRADDATGLTKAEHEAFEAKSRAEATAFLAALNGMIRSALVR